jgi:osmoprotectant transport system permease protein
MSFWLRMLLCLWMGLFVPLNQAIAETHVTRGEPTLTVGSKRFTESYILGEIIARIATQVGEARVVLRPGLGNTGILIAALKSAEIDLYPEYTGTIVREILHSPTPLSLAEMNQQLAPLGLAASIPLGFNNTYALAMREDLAEQLHIRTISDLKNHPELRLGLTQEFIGRQDGWPGLKARYGLPYPTPRGIDHGLIYGAIDAKQVDVMDAYTTDAMLERYPIRILQDDLAYFPDYKAVLLYRAELPTRLPRTWAALGVLEHALPASEMIKLNSQAEQGRVSVGQVARDYLTSRSITTSSATYSANPRANPSATPGVGYVAAHASPVSPWQHFLQTMFADDFWRLTREHIVLVMSALMISICVGVPLGVLAYRFNVIRQPVLGSISVIHTIPSLALFALFIPLLGRIGFAPAICALVLYGLLPIVRNTYSGLSDISAEIKESAQVLGLGSLYRLLHIELPLASRSILSGIKTSAIINVGTATIAAFIGAGGFGERIAQGLALNDNVMLLAGAIPAAALALLVHALFEYQERWLVPKGLRAEPSRAISAYRGLRGQKFTRTGIK